MSKCPYCKSKNVFVDVREGNIVCKNCGTIIEARIIDESDEIRNFGKDQIVAGGEVAKRHAGIANNQFLSDSGLGTIIEFPAGSK